MTNVIPSTLPHVEWLDLQNNGIMHECAIMRVDEVGNKYFFPINNLDRIDKSRLVRILRDRNVQNFELWDLMSNVTLNNGVNALEYFHQLVKVLTPNGEIMIPKSGVRGAPSRIDTNADPMAAAKQRVAEQKAAEAVAAEAEAKAAKSKNKNK